MEPTFSEAPDVNVRAGFQMTEEVEALRLGSKGTFVLVEFYTDGRIHRAWVDAGRVREVGGNKVLADRPEAGIPYGVPWEHAVKFPQVSTSELADALRKQGIWTADDLRLRPNAALSAISNTFGAVLKALILAAEQHEREVSGS